MIKARHQENMGGTMMLPSSPGNKGISRYSGALGYFLHVAVHKIHLRISLLKFKAQKRQVWDLDHSVSPDIEVCW